MPTRSNLAGWNTLTHSLTHPTHTTTAHPGMLAVLDGSMPASVTKTRIEVTSEIVGWIRDRDATSQILCMTGSVGAGKSALVSERCAGGKILAASYCFNARDSTRDNFSGLLGQKNPGLRQLIGVAVEDDPLIFDKALKARMEALIVDPVHRFLANDPSNSEAFPYALLISPKSLWRMSGPGVVSM
ncbi:hypothetical protein D9611_003746 [Ephemerocybe angulata]|uniref:Orc1-like AAA ATPase domain-containing protein n=1 Tax=Ephemerocybe angulata TaxID=980116 RepID=A0A8H5EYE3_9AGAR|nr:hypothetical protein D9611_003746 [Tulosesus angulatus]